MKPTHFDFQEAIYCDDYASLKIEAVNYEERYFCPRA